MYDDNYSQQLNSKGIFEFSTLNWRGINYFGYGYILCVGQCNLLFYSSLLWKHYVNEDGIFQSNFWLCKGWTSTRELTVKKEQVIIKYFRRS